MKIIDKIKVIEDTEISLYKWCGMFFEHFTADRKNYIRYEYKWGDLYIPCLDDFSLTLPPAPISPSREWYVVEGGDICGEVGSENYHFANEELEKEFYTLLKSESGEEPLRPDEIFWEIVKDYPTDTLEDCEHWLRLDPEHKEMVKAFSPYIKEAWDYDRMSESGKETYKKLCLKLGWEFETEENQHEH